MAYVKLFSHILDSTIWLEPLATKVVWITMLAMADRGGVVGAAVPGLARRAGVSVEECEAALRRFQEPDEESRSQEFEGRRIEKVDGGWRLLNYQAYREKLGIEERREYKRIKQAQYDERRKSRGSGGKVPLAGERLGEMAAEGDLRAQELLDEVPPGTYVATGGQLNPVGPGPEAEPPLEAPGEEEGARD